MHSEDIPVPSKLMCQEIANRPFERDNVGSGPSRHDNVHHVAALAAVELAAPFLLHQFARHLLAAIVTNVVMPLDQSAQAAGAELDAISVAMKRELRRNLAGGRAGAVSALDDASRLGVARQPLPLPASQYDESLNGHGATVIFPDRVGIAPVAKAARQRAPHLFVQCLIRYKAGAAISTEKLPMSRLSARF